VTIVTALSDPRPVGSSSPLDIDASAMAPSRTIVRALTWSTASCKAGSAHERLGELFGRVR
jgi:hypothetical protein